VADVLHGEQSSTPKDRDFLESGFGRQVAESRSATVLTVPVLTDFAVAHETAR